MRILRQIATGKVVSWNKEIKGVLFREISYQDRFKFKAIATDLLEANMVIFKESANFIYIYSKDLNKTVILKLQ